MTEKKTLLWIKQNLVQHVAQAIDESKLKNPSLIYTTDWLAAMTYRETGFLIARYATVGKTPEEIHLLMRGDYSQRKNETEKRYHGFGYMQIDIDSYPEFIHQGSWKNPYKTFLKSISVLEEKRNYLFNQNRFSVNDFPVETVFRAITAAYNCGQGNVSRALREGKDVDIFTHQHNYSAEVWRLREIYKSLPQKN